MRKTFREYEPDQLLLPPPNMREWLPENHLALFVADVVEVLDLSAIYAAYDNRDPRGRPPYAPRMMVALTHNLLKLVRFQTA